MKKKYDPRKVYPRRYKQRGEWVELLFMARAAQLGLKVAKPHGESGAFDAIIEGAKGLIRVQVKSTASLQRTSYSCNCSCGTYHAADWDKKRGRKGGYYTWRIGRKPYSQEQTDFIAAYVIPEDKWFIIPLEQACGSAMMLPSSKRKTFSKYERYREAWHLLGVDDDNLTIHAAAVDEEYIALLKAKIMRDVHSQHTGKCMDPSSD